MASAPRPPHGSDLDTPYRRFFEDLSEAAYVVDQQTGTLLAVNARAAEVYGYTVDELLGQPARIVSAEPEKTHAAVTSVDVRQRFRLHRRKDGSVFPIESQSTMSEWGGRPVRIGIIRDVSERRAADAERAEVSERLAKLASRVPGVVYQFRLRPDGAVTVPFTSPGMRDLFDVDLEAIRADARGLFARIHADDHARVQASISASAADLTPWLCEFRVQLGGGERWLLGNSMPEREADGGTLWHGFITDVTERRRLQAGLSQSDRLTSMGMLAAGVAHEINNPLSYVLANLDAVSQELPKLAGFTRRCVAMIRQELGDARLAALVADAAEVVSLDELVGSLEAALEGTRRIRKISRGLGTFARVERAELDAVDLNVALETAATMAQNEVKFRATLVKDLGRVPLVLASDGKLAQVFLNLIINAAHAIAEGHVEANRITLRTWAEGGQVFAEVSDTGHGIAPDHLERVFEPFFTTKQVGVGSGLGLAITRSLVTEFGGQISVASEVGRGTTFRLAFPARVEPPLAAAPVPAEAPAAAPRARVLVVDDEAPIRRILARVLGKDHELVALGSGREARALLERDRAFDVILCDLMMPEMTGMELHAWLNEVDPPLAERVIFCSGGAFTPRAAEYLERVGNPRLEKPFDPRELRELVAQRVTPAGGHATAR